MTTPNVNAAAIAGNGHDRGHEVPMPRVRQPSPWDQLFDGSCRRTLRPGLTASTWPLRWSMPPGGCRARKRMSSPAAIPLHLML